MSSKFGVRLILSIVMCGVVIAESSAVGGYTMRVCDKRYCWCSDPDSNDKDEASTTPLVLQDELTCPDTRGRCRKEYHRSQDPFLADAFQPACAEDGILYLRKQCYEAMGPASCWCVNPEDRSELPHSRLPKDASYNLDCEKGPTNCQIQAADYGSKWGYNLYGVSTIPQCDKNGNFETKQSNGIDYWCVDSVTGDRDDSVRPSMNCLVQQNKNCWDEKKASQSSNSMGAFVPVCQDELNLYKPKQCYGASGIPSCWCVDVVTGKETPGTRLPQKASYYLDCEHGLSKCQKQAADYASLWGFNLYGVSTIPQCDEYGLFERKQSDGVIYWCVDPMTGDKDATSSPSTDCATELDSVPHGCKVQPVDDGTMTLTSEMTNGFVQTKALVTYACDEGFKMKGKKRIRCKKSGEFNRDPPSCVPVLQGRSFLVY